VVDSYSLVISTKGDNWFEESFRFVLLGYNVIPLEMNGTIGIGQLKKLLKFLKQRRFQNHLDFIVQKNICNSSWFEFSLIIKSNSKLKIVDIGLEKAIEYLPKVLM